MTPAFAPFALCLGGALLGAVLMCAWGFRASPAPLSVKLALPVLLAALAVGAPYSVKAMMGFPVEAEAKRLPRAARLIAFVEEAGAVDLWLEPPGAAPRAWRIEETDALRRTLSEAWPKLAHGERVYVERSMGAEGQRFQIKAATLPEKAQ